MKEYEVTICEKLEMKVVIEADSPQKAEQLAEERWSKGEYILDAGNFTGVDFTAKRVREKEIGCSR